MKNKFDNLKCNYFFDRILDILKGKFLSIIKYNKKMQKRANISSKDYDEYCRIKIEIIPEPYKFGTFINISSGESIYYHIYFNNNLSEEIKRNRILSEEKVDKINIIIDSGAKKFKGLFKCCECIESISFKQFYRNDIFDMEDMFYECSSLKKIDFTVFKTDYVSNMKNMFYNCKNLKELDISIFLFEIMKKLI